MRKAAALTSAVNVEDAFAQQKVGLGVGLGLGLGLGVGPNPNPNPNPNPSPSRLEAIEVNPMLAVERYLQLLEHGRGGAQLVHGAQQIELEPRSAQPGGGVVLGVH